MSLCLLQGIVLSKELSLITSGQYTQEGYASAAIFTLNDSVPYDNIWFLRTTFDFTIDGAWGNGENKRIHFYDTMRFRFLWGNSAETRAHNSTVGVSNIILSVPGRSTNKHVVWTKEGWLKFFLDQNCTKNFMQIGLIPYEVGRGISLGSAYDVSGYLGFQADFSIDQFAPGIVFHFTPVEEKYSTDIYFALLKNRQNTLSETLEPVYLSATAKPITRGIGNQSYVIVWEHKIFNAFSTNMTIEPYIIHCHAPDQMVEFPSDSSVFLTTMGFAVDGKQERWNWGFEGAFNFGDMNLKFWDKNGIDYVKNDDGYVFTQFTKIYDQDQKDADAKLVYATETNTQYVQGSALSVSMNGKQIGPNLYNAYNRFRPAQKLKLEGYYFLGDIEVEVIPKRLTVAWGAGYGSGTEHFYQDLNEVSQHECMNQNIGGFVPLQSEYVGKRIRHVVMFHQGVPRFDEVILNPKPITNLVKNIESRTIQDLTNIIFTGTRLNWHATSLEKYKTALSANCIAYWAPVVTEHILLDEKKHIVPSNFLGTEFSFELYAVLWDKITCQGYGGVLFPGGYYKDNKGFVLTEDLLPTGDDPAVVAGFTATFSF